MRVPSVKAIESGLGVERDVAVKVRDALKKGAEDPTVWRTRFPLRVALREVDTILGNHGVESFTGPRGSVAYSNTGDTYAPTIALISMNNGRDRWYVGSWGDIVERGLVGVTS